jgi:predicted nucleotidyltransferase
MRWNAPLILNLIDVNAMTVNEQNDLLQQVVKRIVGAVHPQRILLFGSAARGQMGPDSDFDVLVIVREGIHRGETCKQAYRSLKGLGFAVDIVVVTERDVLEHVDNPYYVIKPALDDGVELYRVAA